MTTFLPPEVQAGLDDARKRAWKKSHRLWVRSGRDRYRVVRVWDDGFSLDRSRSAHLRGRITLTDGNRLVSDCLIVASGQDGDEMHFEYKRMTRARDERPLDFERDADAPRALTGPG